MDHVNVMAIIDLPNDAFLTRGTHRWIVAGQLIFTLGKNIKRGLVDGENNSGLYEFTHQGKAYFVKGLATITPMNARKAYDEERVATVLHQLGVGPKTDIIIISDRFYLVMEKVAGVNIKEIVYDSMMTTQTKMRALTLLNQDRVNPVSETTTVHATRVLFARRLMENSSFETQLLYLDQLFNNHGVQS